MKTIKFYFATVVFIGLISSCNNAPKGEQAVVGEAKKETMTAPTKVSGTTSSVNKDKSVVNWAGSKIGGTHKGTLKLKDGNLSIIQGMVKGGSFTIDMNSLTCTDMAPNEGGTKLEGHLKNGDFFDVEKYPTASFKINKVTGLAGAEGSNSMVYGNLNIKDATKEIGFKANIKTTDGITTVTTDEFGFDRTDFGIKYGSSKFFDNLKDKTINDKVTISLSITTE